MTTNPRQLRALMVRRYGEDDTTPVVLDDRHASCGTAGDCIRAGCIGLTWDDGRGSTGLWHLTNDEAGRLADLLHAMSDTGKRT